MKQKSFILKGDICFSESPTELKTKENGYLVCVDGISQGVFDKIPDEYKDFKLIDYTGKLIMPGLVDLHLHAPQYHYRGLGMDLELLDWLQTYTFPHEAKYVDVDYAKEAYERFIKDLVKGPNTRFSIFSTLHVPSTILLMDMMEESGLVSFVGKVNMDRNGTDELEEVGPEVSARKTREWLDDIKGKYERTFPILTPRFIPSCSDELMELLKKIQSEYKIPIQSHLSESPGEIEWVKELCPDSTCYGDAYEQFKMLGSKDAPTIMAHCVWSDEVEQNLLKERGVYIAHCPNSNMNLSSGIAPIRKYLNDGQNVGLGSDVAGGTHLSIFRAMSDAIQVSKLRWRLVDESLEALKVEEAFYLGTLGGGSFFGNVGSFKKGFEFDAIVLDDETYSPTKDWNIHQRLERTIYLSENNNILHKFVRGRKIF